MSCKVSGNKLTITVGAATVKFATENHPDFYDPDNNKGTLRVRDAEVWLKEVGLAIESEREDGSSLLSDLFDKAIAEAAEQSSEGLHYDD